MTAKIEQERVEQLQALGFADESDYIEHQRVMAKADELHKAQSVLVSDGEWCLIQR